MKNGLPECSSKDDVSEGAADCALGLTTKMNSALLGLPLEVPDIIDGFSKEDLAKMAESAETHDFQAEVLRFGRR